MMATSLERQRRPEIEPGAVRFRLRWDGAELVFDQQIDDLAACHGDCATFLSEAVAANPSCSADDLARLFLLVAVQHPRAHSASGRIAGAMIWLASEWVGAERVGPWIGDGACEVVLEAIEAPGGTLWWLDIAPPEPVAGLLCPYERNPSA